MKGPNTKIFETADLPLKLIPATLLCLINVFLGSMLPQYMALSVTLRLSKKICVSVRWVTLWVRPPLYENMCVRSLGYIVGASPPSLDPCMLPTPLCGIFCSRCLYNHASTLPHEPP